MCSRATDEPTLQSSDRDLLQYIPLTPREQEVMEVLINGLGAKFAARELCVSYETIRTHQRNIYRKLGARTLCNAVNLYRAHIDTYRLRIHTDAGADS